MKRIGLWIVLVVSSAVVFVATLFASGLVLVGFTGDYALAPLLMACLATAAFVAGFRVRWLPRERD